MNTEILNIVNQIESEAFWLLLKLIGVGIVLLALKGWMEGVVAYIQFRLNRRLGLGVKVRVRGAEGKIIDYNLSWILVETKSGIEIISMKRQRFEKWTLLSNGDS